MSWIVYKRGTIKPYNGNFVFKAIFKFKMHPVGSPHPKTLYINEGDKLHWGWHKAEMEKFWKKFLIIFQSPVKLERYLARTDKYLGQAFQAATRIERQNLEKLSNAEILELFNILERAVAPANFILNIDVDAFDLYFEDWLRAKIKRELGWRLPADRQAEISGIIAQPLGQTYVNKQEIAAMRLAVKKDFSRAAMMELYKKFWWTNLGWENVRPHQLSFFLNLIKHWAKRKDLREALRRAESLAAANRRERNRFLKKFHLSPTLRYCLSVGDRYVYYHDRRKELQVKSLHAFHLLLQEVARRQRIPVGDLEWLWYDDVRKILRGGPVDRNEIKRRQRCLANLTYYHYFQYWSGGTARKIKRANIKENAGLVRELRGLGVAGHNVKGRVKVCAGVQEALAKVKRGDILVCPMTTPDYVPALKRAKAVITEEGGITCHAAIIAREFKIPCIVGTKIATKILHDGDEIEVDANKGIVKIIK
jgi:phosphohistidine swiveling domain-containing protein